MYYQFYELDENPFNVTADASFFYSGAQYGKAAALLLYGIRERKGIMVVSGEIGTGKTTLCRKLLNIAGKNIHFALVLNPAFSETELLQVILQDFGIKTRKQSKFDLVNTLNKFLLKESRKGKNVVLIIDEAQNLTPEQLECIRLLSNLETEKDKLLQIILVGQPELMEKLRLPELRQLCQRIAVSYNLSALSMEDIRAYIDHRLSRAASRTERLPVFTEQAIEGIYTHTKGFPRAINILCDRVLTAGFVSEIHQIDSHLVDHCAKEVLFCEYYS